MKEISKKYVIADRQGTRTLFLFNKHLSYLGPAIGSLNSDIEKKINRFTQNFKMTLQLQRGNKVIALLDGAELIKP